MRQPVYAASVIKSLRLSSVQAANSWNASFIKLVSYSDNNEALRFYARLGFASLRGETGLTLSGAPLAALSRQTQKDPQ